MVVPRRHSHAAVSAMALLALALALLLLAPAPASARKMLQTDESRSQSTAAAPRLGGAAFEEDAPEPKDGTPFGSDSDALVASWSKEPVRQVSASEEGEEEYDLDAAFKTKAVPAPVDEDGSVSAPDDGLFDEESGSAPIYTAVNPDEFLEPPSSGGDKTEAVEEKVADGDLFDEETPEVPIVTAVNPAEFVEKKKWESRASKNSPAEVKDGVEAPAPSPASIPDDESGSVPKLGIDLSSSSTSSSSPHKKGNAATEKEDTAEAPTEMSSLTTEKEDAASAPSPSLNSAPDKETAKEKGDTAEASTEMSSLTMEEEDAASAPSPSPSSAPDKETGKLPKRGKRSSSSSSSSSSSHHKTGKKSSHSGKSPNGSGEPHGLGTKTAGSSEIKDDDSAPAPSPAPSPEEAPNAVVAEAPTQAPAQAPAEAPKEDNFDTKAADDYHTKKGHARIQKKASTGIKAKMAAVANSAGDTDLVSAPSPAPSLAEALAVAPAPAPSPEIAPADAVVQPTDEAPAILHRDLNDFPARRDAKDRQMDAEDIEAIAAAGSSYQSKRVLSASVLSKEPTDVIKLVKKVVTYPSDCVPDDTAVLVHVNYHHIPLFKSQVKNVIKNRCFMRRYVLLALDGKTMDECRKMQINGVELHCAKSSREYGRNTDSEAQADGALSSTQKKDILFDRWTVVADMLEATPNLKLWVFDADVVIFKVPTLEFPTQCDFSAQMDKLEALGGADIDAAVGMASLSPEDAGQSADRRLLANADTAAPSIEMVPHKDRAKYSMNGGQVVLQNNAAVIAFLRAVGKRGENSEESEDLDYMVMAQLMQKAKGKPWESMTSCDLPESFSSACWGLDIQPFTFHANCVDSAEEKLKQMHNAVKLIASTVSPSTGELTFAEGYPAGSARYCWDMGTMCKGMCEKGKLCEAESNLGEFQ